MIGILFAPTIARASIPCNLLGALLAMGLLTALPASLAFAVEPCCGIVAIDKATGTVTLRDNKTGKTETVTVKDPAKLSKLSVVPDADHCSAIGNIGSGCAGS